MKENTYFLLSDIAHGRSGDKGNHSNIGIIAYQASFYPFLKSYLTSSRVKRYFKASGVTEVTRYEMANILAFNFVLKNALGGGGGSSLRIDTQGKLFATALLQLEIPTSAIKDKKLLSKIKLRKASINA